MNNNRIPPSVREAYQRLSFILKSRQASELARKLDQAWTSVENDATDINAINMLGAIADNIRQFALAETIFGYAVHLAPRNALLHGNLAIALKGQGKTDAAVSAFQTALKINPKLVEYYKAIADIYISRGKNDLLIDFLRGALAACPESPKLLVYMGEAINRSGDSNTAVDYFRRALKLNPTDGYTHQTLANAKKFKRHDEDVMAIEALLEDQDLSDETICRLNFALGKIYEDLADYDRSFGYYEEGNRIAREGFEYSYEEDARRFSDIEEVFDRRFFEQHEFSGCDSDRPVFIVGMPRSGTSLLEQMLANHPRVFGGGELLLLPGILHSLWAKNVTPRGSHFPLGANTLSSEALRGACEHYINSIGMLADRNDFIRVTDKLPHNFLYIGIIRLLMPNAHIIHCRRDPMDSCFSSFKRYFTVGHKYSFNLLEMGKYYLLYQRLMAHWHALFPGEILDIHYESLVEDQVGELKRVLDFCGLPWDDACLTFHDSRRVAMTASASQIKKPLYKSGIAYWRHYEKHLKPLLDILDRDHVEQ